MKAIGVGLNSAGVLAEYVCVVDAYQVETMWAELDIDLCMWSGLCNKGRLLGWKWFLSGSYAECDPMIQHKFSSNSMGHPYKLQKRNGCLRSRVITCQMYVGGTIGWSHKMAYYFWCQSVKDITWKERKLSKLKERKKVKATWVNVQFVVYDTYYAANYCTLVPKYS